jgi:hypothetical protein
MSASFLNYSTYIYVRARSFLLDGLRNILLNLFGERTLYVSILFLFHLYIL